MSKSELKRLCTQDPIEMAKRIAALEYQLQEEIDYTAQLQNMLAEYKQRAEAAEAKLRELEMQEPVGEINVVDNRYPGSGVFAYCTTHIKGMTKHGQKLYAKPFPEHKQEEK